MSLMCIRSLMMLSNFLFYFLLYFFCGFILVSYLVIQAYIRNLSHFFDDNIIKDALICFLCILLWPIIIMMISYSLYEDWKYSKTNNQYKQFELQLTDLVEKITICEVELREFVCDPLNAAPSIPFGHLNSAWLKFCEDLESQDELWTFDLLWSSPWGKNERFAGYASVRNGKINMIFYTL